MRNETEETVADAGRVLLVDDDRFLLDAYSLKFRHEGFKTYAHLSVDEALQTLRQGIEVDAILFDLVMPQKDGFAFLAALREEKLTKNAVLIALTNQMEDTERAKVEELGGDRYLIKASVIPSEVVAVVREEIARRAKKKK